ncbi:MAG: hypothetical protein F6K19_03180 [Cyanothece sp. SIO1E1]|nr:hypothetical protein [Cyanothece sp. SIO1E1]
MKSRILTTSTARYGYTSRKTPYKAAAREGLSMMMSILLLVLVTPLLYRTKNALNINIFPADVLPDEQIEQVLDSWHL